MVIDSINKIKAFVPYDSTGYRVFEGLEPNEVTVIAEELITNLINRSRCSLPKLIRAMDLHNNSLKKS
jgi:hypothetical protein